MPQFSIVGEFLMTSLLTLKKKKKNKDINMKTVLNVINHIIICLNMKLKSKRS